MNNIESGIVDLANAFNAAPFTRQEYLLLCSVMDENRTYIVASRATADALGNVINTSYPLKSSLTGGSATRPVYMNNGTVNQCTYSLNKSVPSDAKFTDTTELSLMTGVLPVSKGGTGGTDAASARTALGLGSSATANAKDNTTATAIGQSSSVVTERTVYNGLPKINGVHNYTANNDFYVPSTGGTHGYILTATGSGSAPIWKNPQEITIGTSETAKEAEHAATADSATLADKASKDGAGNNIATTYATKAETIKQLTFNADATVDILYANGSRDNQQVVGSLLPPIAVQSTAPTNTHIIWVDSANGFIGKVYYNGAWLAMRGAWG